MNYETIIDISAVNLACTYLIKNSWHCIDGTGQPGFQGHLDVVGSGSVRLAVWCLPGQPRSTRK